MKRKLFKFLFPISAVIGVSHHVMAQSIPPGALSGTVIWGGRSWEDPTNPNNTYVPKSAFDGNVDTYPSNISYTTIPIESTYVNWVQDTALYPWVGLHFAAPTVIKSIIFTSRPGGTRLYNAVIQGANNANFSDAVTLATLTPSVVDGAIRSYTPLISTNKTSTFQYARLMTTGEPVDVGELKFYATDSAYVFPKDTIAGVIKWGGRSWSDPTQSTEWTPQCAFDGNLKTYPSTTAYTTVPTEPQYANYVQVAAAIPWVGLEFNVPSKIKFIAYSSRGGSQALYGARIQGANNADYSDAVDLATITQAQADASVQMLSYLSSIDKTTVFKYARIIVADAGKNVDVGELKFYANENTLPIKISSFTAIEKNKHALLEWTTSSEINVSHFNIQRSIDGKIFSTIKTVNAIGNTDISQSYSIEDNMLSSLRLSEVYYRLEIVDYDGKIEYSDIFPLRTKLQSSILLYPNPAHNILFIKGDNIDQIKINDLNGKPVLSFSKNAINLPINIASLSAGIYFVYVYHYDGKIEIQKLMVQ